MGLNLRYSPLEWEQNTNSFNFGGAQLENFVASRVFGQTFWVCGTNGGDSDNGLTLDHAFKTIQKAITAQIAHRARAAKGYNRGDQIAIMPGTYAESLTGNLTNCKLAGAFPDVPFAVKIQPTASHAYTGTLTNSVIENVTFYSPSTTSTSFAAVRLKRMMASTLQGCFFYCAAVSATSTAFRIGEEAGSNEYDKMSESAFINNRIATYSAGKNFYYGICFGKSAATDTNNRYTYMQESIIAGNIISAEHYGIMMGVIYTSGSGAIIANNSVGGGLLLAGQCAHSGIRAYDRGHDNKLIKVYDNRVSAQTDAIDGFGTQNVMGNIVGVGGNAAQAPTSETGQ